MNRIALGVRRSETSRAVAAQTLEAPLRSATVRSDSFETRDTAFARRKAKQAVEPGSAPQTMTRALKPGMTGEDVKVVQQKLKDAGYDVEVNGTYDEKTVAAVTKYQADEGLEGVDGIAGRETYEALGLPYVKGGGGKPAAPARDARRAGETDAQYDARLRHEAAVRLVANPPPKPSTATQEDVDLVVAELEKLPLKDLQTLEKKKVRVVVARDNVTDYRPDLKGKTPPGWDGGTYEECAGGYMADLPPKKDLVIATVPGADGRRRLPGPDQTADPARGISGTTSANVVVHEATHAVDAVSGRPSDSKEFDAAFDADRDRPGSKMGSYWNQPTNEKAGRHEAYAESLALYRDDPEALKRDFPAIYAYWEKRLGPPPGAANS